jgi:hypothetical protein
MTPIAGSSSDAGATNPPNPGPSATGEVQAARDDLRADLAAVIAHPKMPADIRRFAGEDECDRCTRALDAADAVLAAGFRRVSEDDDTVEQVAQALAVHDGYVWDVVDGAADNVANPDYYLARARAAVRALREET